MFIFDLGSSHSPGAALLMSLPTRYKSLRCFQLSIITKAHYVN